jgi:hypothetical protein
MSFVNLLYISQVVTYGALQTQVTQFLSLICVHTYAILPTSGVPRIFGGEGVQQIRLKTEGRSNGDMGAVAP